MLTAYESMLSSMTYGERLDQALKLAGKDAKSLATELGVSVQAVYQVISGKTKALTAENSAFAAVYLGVSSVWLATGKGAPHTDRHLQAESANQATGNSGNWPFRRVNHQRISALPEEAIEFIDENLDALVQQWERKVLDKKRSIG
ncbi:helix-turn-helix domain-containing protein [Comamonas sp. BIGb0124]|uniref:helix-turn-helix domain-containing protein n=1 Tax=Comamonas sp. BIGb0124 TaxID=2485130 RepID=UPI0013154C9B|nr:helix-turn-helix domain-containing protein [Comamonas sp. BIGb0124]